MQQLVKCHTGCFECFIQAVQHKVCEPFFNLSWHANCILLDVLIFCVTRKFFSLLTSGVCRPAIGALSLWHYALVSALLIIFAHFCIYCLVDANGVF